MIDNRYVIEAQIDVMDGDPTIAHCRPVALAAAAIMNAFLAHFTPLPYVTEGTGD